MGCSDSSAASWGGHTITKDKIDKLTRMLCNICSYVETSYNKLENTNISTECIMWWEEHQKQDAERIKREKETLAREELRIKLLKQLTTEEKHALGIRGGVGGY